MYNPDWYNGESFENESERMRCLDKGFWSKDNQDGYEFWWSKDNTVSYYLMVQVEICDPRKSKCTRDEWTDYDKNVTFNGMHLVTYSNDKFFKRTAFDESKFKRTGLA